MSQSGDALISLRLRKKPRVRPARARTFKDLHARDTNQPVASAPSFRSVIASRGSEGETGTVHAPSGRDVVINHVLV